jgi:superfamily II DNA/RNA helicase
MKYVPQHLRDRDRESEPDFEVYLHRVGRAGRFGRKGKFPSSCLLSVV